jgi:RNA polymerase sigma-70 factor (ECF subfamily)
MRIMVEDHELLGAWQRGDRQAAEVLIERHFDAISGFFRTKAHTHADDLVQRTFLRCAEHLDRFKADGTVRAFLFGIARNVFYEFLREKKRHGPEPDFSTSSLCDLQPGAVTQLSRRAEDQLLLEALHRIPIELQIAIELYYWDELSIDELAVALDVPSGTVKSRLHRARALLRDAIDAVPGALDDERAKLHARLDASA